MPPSVVKRAPVALILFLLALVPAAVSGQSGRPRVVSVTPARDGSWLVCYLRTEGLPGQKISLSLQSGLISSVELLLDLLDGNQKVVASSRVTYQLAFDLFEEVFTVQGPAERHRLDDGSQLARFFSELPRLPVSALAAVGPAETYRIRAGLTLHPIAPLERERVEAVIAGDPGGKGVEREDRQEVSFGLGSLIRFFYRQKPDLAGADLSRLSGNFRLEELRDAED